ncbi:AAA family ATPase [Robertmurraya kyonggiensis]|uniref:Shikimate kinase n=1 Tax=Robertmurraya kyonggiensis TaxID=1037680 RepID=A0A4U1D9S8_9BACI|nr:AAA family ATPase [Robertmurraya kyonggiensis]TKC18868.1 shikimate kinase [Robertmurraya kyonggiensis]
MKFVLIFGPQAVGKMTVGQELAKMTELKLFHNHMSIDLVNHFFDYGTRQGKRLVSLFREELFEEVSKSNVDGLIFTFVWAFDLQSDWEYVEKISRIFESKGGTVYYVELEADLETRMERNQTSNRLEHKPSKRNIEKSEADLLETLENHRLNSFEGEIQKENYIKIINNQLSAAETSKLIKERFQL